MGKVIFNINLSIDGCCDHTKLSGDDDVYDYFSQLLRDVGTFVFGRKTYQLMVPFWPDVAKNHSGANKAMNDFAQAFASVGNIVVFSRSLEMVEGRNTRIVHTSPLDEIRQLKQEQGKEISIGALNLLSQLVESRVFDDYRFVVHPVVVGEGRRLLEGISLQEKLQLKLVESAVFKSGCVACRYLKR